jgi:hypothetical protein
MSRMKVSIDLRLDPVGYAAVQMALNNVKVGVQNRAVKDAVGKAARKVARDVKQQTRRGPTGALKAAIGVVYKSYQKRTVWVFLIGARSGVVRWDTRYAKARRHVPTYYAHLDERGRGPLSSRGPWPMRFFPTPRARHLVSAYRVRAAVGSGAVTRGYRTLLAGGMVPQINADIVAAIYRIAAQYARRGKSIYNP